MYTRTQPGHAYPVLSFAVTVTELPIFLRHDQPANTKSQQFGVQSKVAMKDFLVQNSSGVASDAGLKVL